MANKLPAGPSAKSTSKNSFPEADPESIKWNSEMERSLMLNMIRLKPCGINKHLNMHFIQNKISKDLKFKIPSKSIWKYLDSHWNVKAADIVENTSLNIGEKFFEFPEEYKGFISKEDWLKINTQTCDKQCAECIEVDRLELISSKSRTMFNFTSLLDYKASLTDPNHSSRRGGGVKREGIPSPRRSLRTNDKTEEKEPYDATKGGQKLPRSMNKIDIKKVTDSKQPNKNVQNQSKDLEKNIVLNTKTGKRKTRNLSESSFSSDNSKQPKNVKISSSDLNISDSSSRSVTPEISKGKTSKRSVTPETSRKTNLRSSDKDQKLKSFIKMDFNNMLPEVRIERMKLEKVEKLMMEAKAKSLAQKKIELKRGKTKVRGRITSDLLVAQQSPVMKLGRRSCSNKTL